MAKTYPELLGEWVKQRESTRRDKNLVAFLAVRDDVKAAVEAGYAVKTVWTNMHESKRIMFGYDTFLNYVNRLIRRPQVDQTATTGSSSTLTKAGRKTAAQVKPAEAAASFSFNPVPNKEELL